MGTIEILANAIALFYVTTSAKEREGAGISGQRIRGMSIIIAHVSTACNAI